MLRRTHTLICSKPTRPNLKGDIRNKFDTSAYPRSALRTKRNLISDKPPDRISALALCCWFTAIPSTLTSHTLAQFPCIPPPLHWFFFLFPLLLSLPFLTTSFHSPASWFVIKFSFLHLTANLSPFTSLLSISCLHSLFPFFRWGCICSQVWYILYISIFLFLSLVGEL